jgi:hypothetical protein
VGVVVAVGAVAALRVILGPILATVVLTPAVSVAILCGWSLAERRLFPDPPPVERWAGPVIDVASRPVSRTVGAAPARRP